MKHTTYFRSIDNGTDIWAFRKGARYGIRLYLNPNYKYLTGTFGYTNYWTAAEMTFTEGFFRVSRASARHTAGKYFKKLHAKLDSL